MIVTGAAGFVGAHLTRALVQAGRNVVAVDRAPRLPEVVTRGTRPGLVSYICGDLINPLTTARVLSSHAGPLDVVHAAAIINFNQLASTLGGSGPALADALRSFEVNTVVPWQLCVALADSGRLRRLLHVSTRAVFGGRPPTAEPIREDEPLQPAGLYGSSKAAAELGLAGLREQFGLDIRVARITGAFGPWQGPVSWVGQAVDAIVAGRPYRATAGSNDGYELTYVKDVVRGLVGLLDARQLAHAIYHVASSEALITLGTVATLLNQQEAGADVDFGPGSVTAAAGRTSLSTERISTELGYAPRWDLGAALADYIAVERTGDYGTEAAAEPPAMSATT